MESRVALIGIIVENEDAVEKLNCVLHEYGRYIVGRMGIPYREKKINIISAMSGKIGKLDGVSAKTAYSNVVTEI